MDKWVTSVGKKEQMFGRPEVGTTNERTKVGMNPKNLNCVVRGPKCIPK